MYHASFPSPKWPIYTWVLEAENNRRVKRIWRLSAWSCRFKRKHDKISTALQTVGYSLFISIIIMAGSRDQN